MARASLRDPGRLGMCCQPDESRNASLSSRVRDASPLLAVWGLLLFRSKTGSAKIANPSVGGGLLAAAFLRLAKAEAEGNRVSSSRLPNNTGAPESLATDNAANGTYCKGPSGTIRSRLRAGNSRGPNRRADKFLDRSNCSILASRLRRRYSIEV